MPISCLHARSAKRNFWKLTDEQAHRTVEYPWSDGQPISFLELQLYNLRHVPGACGSFEHVSWTESNSDVDLDWVTRAKDDEGNE